MVWAQMSDGMKERRATTIVSPTREDRGIFKRDIVQLDAQLCPVMHHTQRHDLVIAGFTNNGLQFEVVFAGRRALTAASLVAHLGEIKDAAVKATRGKSKEEIDFYAVRTMVMLEGAWRTRVWTDRSGWQFHVHQLMVARWRIGPEDEGNRTFGTMPETD